MQTNIFSPHWAYYVLNYFLPQKLEEARIFNQAFFLPIAVHPFYIFQLVKILVDELIFHGFPMSTQMHVKDGRIGRSPSKN